MKKLCVTIALLTVSISYCQMDKGRFLLGISSSVGQPVGSSSISFVSEKREGDGFETDSGETFAINLTPRLGYFITKNLSVGIQLDFSYTNQTDIPLGEGTLSLTRLTAGPFLRYYFPLKRVFPYAEVGASIGALSSNIEDGFFLGTPIEGESKYSLFGVGGGIGLAIPLGNRVTFDGLLGYTYLSEKLTEDNPDNERTIRNGVYMNLGFSIFLGNGNNNNPPD